MPIIANRHIPVQRLLGAKPEGHSVGKEWAAKQRGGTTVSGVGTSDIRIACSFSDRLPPRTAAGIIADVPNYTNSQPIIQIAELKL